MFEEYGGSGHEPMRTQPRVASLACIVDADDKPLESAAMRGVATSAIQPLTAASISAVAGYLHAVRARAAARHVLGRQHAVPVHDLL
jgi:hypothetical protein